MRIRTRAVVYGSPLDFLTQPILMIKVNVVILDRILMVMYIETGCFEVIQELHCMSLKIGLKILGTLLQVRRKKLRIHTLLSHILMQRNG